MFQRVPCRLQLQLSPLALVRSQTNLLVPFVSLSPKRSLVFFALGEFLQWNCPLNIASPLFPPLLLTSKLLFLPSSQSFLFVAVCLLYCVFSIPFLTQPVTLSAVPPLPFPPLRHWLGSTPNGLVSFPLYLHTNKSFPPFIAKCFPSKKNHKSSCSWYFELHLCSFQRLRSWVLLSQYWLIDSKRLSPVLSWGGLLRGGQDKFPRGLLPLECDKNLLLYLRVRYILEFHS